MWSDVTYTDLIGNILYILLTQDIFSTFGHLKILTVYLIFENPLTRYIFMRFNEKLSNLWDDTNKIKYRLESNMLNWS